TAPNKTDQPRPEPSVLSRGCAARRARRPPRRRRSAIRAVLRRRVRSSLPGAASYSHGCRIADVAPSYAYARTGILPHALLGLSGDSRAAFSIVLVGNQICRLGAAGLSSWDGVWQAQIVPFCVHGAATP